MHRIFYCLLPLAVAGAMPAQAQGGAWRVSEVSGDVRIAEAGRSRAATRGALLTGGSVIAGARSRAVLVRGRQYMVVSPGSTVRVDSPAGGAGSIVDVAVEAGSALFKVDRRENPHFRVRTRFLAAVVRGTTFSVSVTPAGGTVQVTEGAVQVSSLDGGATDLIRPGMIARIGASDLFRLTVSGDQEKVIRSPAAPAGTVTTAVPRGNGVGVQSAAQPGARIAAPVGEAPVRLREATKGLVSGAPAINLALHGRGGESADRNRGSGNGRDNRDSREDRARHDEPNGRGNGNGGGRGDEEDDAKDKDKDESRPGNGNGRGNEDEGRPGDDDGGKDKDKDEDPNGDPDHGHGNDGDRDDDDNPGKGDGDDKPGNGDGDDKPGDGNGNGGGKDDGDDEDGGAGDGEDKETDKGRGNDDDDEGDDDSKDKEKEDQPGGGPGGDDDDGKDKDDGRGDDEDGDEDDRGKEKDKDNGDDD